MPDKTSGQQSAKLCSSLGSAYTAAQGTQFVWCSMHFKHVLLQDWSRQAWQVQLLLSQKTNTACHCVCALAAAADQIHKQVHDSLSSMSLNWQLLYVPLWPYCSACPATYRLTRTLPTLAHN